MALCCKKFDTERLLSEEQIDIVKKAFNLTATSYGLQPISLVIVANKELQNQLVPHSFEQKQVAQASHVLVICIPENYTTNEVKNYFNLVQKIRNTPDSIINPFKEFLTTEIERKTQEHHMVFVPWKK